MCRLLRRFVKSESGASAAEYALLAAFIAAVIVTAVTLLGVKVTGLFTIAADALTAATDGL